MSPRQSSGWTLGYLRLRLSGTIVSDMNRGELPPARRGSSPDHFGRARVVSARPAHPWPPIPAPTKGAERPLSPPLSPPISHDRRCPTYTCFIFNATDKPLQVWTGEYATESEALREAAKEVFARDDAAGYDLWCEGRKIARFRKP